MDSVNKISSAISPKLLFGFFLAIIILEVVLALSLIVKLPGYSGWGYGSIAGLLLILLMFNVRQFSTSIKNMLINFGIPSIFTLLPILYLAYIFISNNNVIENKSQSIPSFKILKACTTIILFIQTIIFYHYIKSVSLNNMSGLLRWILPIVAFGILNTFLSYKLYINITHFITDGYTNINL